MDIECYVKKFARLFSPGQGQYNKGIFRVALKPDTVPVAMKVRHAPFALRNKIEKELRRLESLGNIEKVDVSRWATPIVPVLKSDKSVRICGDFKVTVNPSIIVDKHPLPLIDEIFSRLQGGQKFSQIDLSHAYMQIPVEEKSRECLTIITHLGLYRYRKLPEGIATGPGDFQRKMETCLQGIKNVAVYIDNIYVTEKDEKSR